MHKIFFGTIVFFSVAFLAACGGGSSGSSGAGGAAGAAGADGATGATGSIAVPSADTNTFVTAAIDTDTDLGQITNTYTITGINNTATMDSRLRYYLYEGSSATVKSATLAGTGASCTGGIASSCTAASALVIDPREMATDNSTLTLTNFALMATTGTITHLIVCPGNEAGDAASCNAVALNDRGEKAGANLSLTGAAPDHALVGVTGSSVYSIVAFDNGSFTTQAITVGSKATAPSLSGSASAHVTSENFEMNGQVVGTSSAVYVIAAVSGDSDNLSLTTVGGSTVYADNITGGQLWDNATQVGAWTVDASADSSGNLYGTILGDDNMSLGAFRFTTSGSQSLTNDNSTFSIIPGASFSNNVCSTVHPSGTAIFASVSHDNTTHEFVQATSAGWSNRGTLGNAQDNLSGYYCAMVFDADGVGYAAVSYDNKTGLSLTRSTDNFTTNTDIGGEIPDGGASLNDLVLAIDPTSKMPILATSYATIGDLWMYDNVSTAWAQLGPDVTVTAGERIGLAVVDTNTFVMSTTSSDNTTITVFYDN